MGRLVGRTSRALCGACFFLIVFVMSAVLAGCVSGFTVSFDANGGVVAPAPVENVTNGSKIGAPIFNLEREEYTFDGKWYREKECTEEWRFDTDIVRDNLTLYAGWIPVASGSDNNGESGANNENEENEGSEENNENEGSDGGNEDNSENNNNENNTGGGAEVDSIKAGLVEELSLFETACGVDWFGEPYRVLLSGIALTGAANINSATDVETAQGQLDAACAEMLHALKSYTAAVIEEYFAGILNRYESGSAQAGLIQGYSADTLRELGAALSVVNVKSVYGDYLLCLSVLGRDLAAAGYIAELNEFVRILGDWGIDIGDISSHINELRSAETAEEAAELFAAVCADIEDKANKADEYFLIGVFVYYDDLLRATMESLAVTNMEKGDDLNIIYLRALGELCIAESFSQIKSIYLTAVAEMEAAVDAN